MKIIVSWSGGKDSQASLIWAANKFGAKNLEAVFCDTGWEHELTYNHVKEITDKLNVKLVTVRSKKYKNMVDLAKKKKRFPSTKARFCTEELKTKPMIDYILSHSEHLFIVQGIRNDESESRKSALETCTYFKHYYEPYQSNSMIVKSLENREKLSLVQKEKLNKAKKRLELGKEDFKYHTYRKKEVLEWRKNYCDDVYRPVLKNTAQEVIDYILHNGQKPLYYKGFSRVGCFPCIMCRHQEIKNIANSFPEHIEKIKNAEIEVGRTFFPPKYIPDSFCSGEENGKKFPFVQDVVSYLQGDLNQTSLFQELQFDGRCMSYYGICE